MEGGTKNNKAPRRVWITEKEKEKEKGEYIAIKSKLIKEKIDDKYGYERKKKKK